MPPEQGFAPSSSSHRAQSRSASSRRPVRRARRCSRYAAASTRRSRPRSSSPGRGTHVLVNSLNPHRLQGQKTAAFEVVEELGGPPDLLTLPYGGGGNTRAYALGFEELGTEQRIVSVQATKRAETLASAIRIATPAHRAEAEAAAEVVSATDDQIIAAWQDLARLEGLFCEPSSAAGIAGLRAHPPEPGSRVVCVITGHGLKDPATVDRTAPPPIEVEADADAIAEAAA